MPESIILHNFKCPICGWTTTITQEACKEEIEKGRIPKNSFVSMEKVVTPIMGPGGPIGLTAPAVLAHYDVCSQCGMRYCTRAEKIQIPITMRGPGGATIPTNMG